MTEQELIYILAIAEEKNITHAAQRLNISQPSLTQCLRKIEIELDTRLFTRRKYGLDLTDAGKLYIDMARDVSSRIETFREDLRKMKDPMNGHLALGASWYNTLIYFSAFVKRFSQLYPDAQIKLVEKRTTDLLDMLKGHEIDIIIAHEYPSEYLGIKENYAKDICRDLLEIERFRLIGNRSILNKVGISYNEPADLQKLKDLPFIFFNDNQRIRRITDHIFHEAGISPKALLSTQSFPGAWALATQAVGLVILPEKYIEQNIHRFPELVSLSLDSSLHGYWSNYIYYRKQEYPDPLRKEAIHILKETKYIEE